MNKKPYSLKYPPPIAVEIVRCLGLFISKLIWKLEFHDTHYIPQDFRGGLLVAANHQTYLDPVWICLPIKRRFRFMAWDKAFEWFLIGDLIRFFGAFPVNLVRGGKQAIREAIESLNDGATLIIFPEGSREFSDGKLLPFKTGAVRIALESDVPILPVTIRGANQVWAQDLNFPRAAKVDIFYHPILKVSQPPPGTDEHQHVENLTETLRKIIESKL